MTRLALLALLGLLGACDPSASPSTTAIELLSSVDGHPLEDGEPILVTIRPQGALGMVVGLQMFGVEPSDVPAFVVSVVTDDGEELAAQAYLPTMTGVAGDDGAVVLRGRHVIFADEVDSAAVDGMLVDLVADMDSTPPARGDVRVRLAMEPSRRYTRR
jgi:hypothetical protein